MVRVHCLREYVAKWYDGSEADIIDARWSRHEKREGKERKESEVFSQVLRWFRSMM